MSRLTGRSVQLSWRQSACQSLRFAMESLLLILIAATPWVYAAIHPNFMFLLSVGVGILLILAALRTLLLFEVPGRAGLVAWCLLGLIGIGVLQSVPLREEWLTIISPMGVKVRHEFSPTLPEVLPGGESIEVAGVDRTISLNAFATRHRVYELALVWAVFVVVTRHVASNGSFRRFSIVALINGALLSAFGLLQYFSSPSNMLYWSVPSTGNVFGPFTVRNHFAFYVNLCIGLGLGVLWSRRAQGDVSANRFHPIRALANYLQDPVSIWIVAALALMSGAVAVSLSRGGLVALAGAFGVCVVLSIVGALGKARLGSVWLILALALGVVSWFGLSKIQARVQTLWSENLQEGRLSFWGMALQIAREYPLAGTGYGTFQSIEPMYRRDPEPIDLMIDYVCNDYLELLSEGGGLALAFALVAVVGVYIRTLRGIRQTESVTRSALCLGGLFAFTTFVIHSFFDFGAHYSAIALCATTLVAQLTATGSAEETGERRGWRLLGLAPVLAAAVYVCVALASVQYFARMYATNRHQVSAGMLGSHPSTEDALQVRINHLEKAVQLTPDDPKLQSKLANSYVDMFRLQQNDPKAKENRERCLAAAVRHYTEARACCPVLSSAYLGLAEVSDRLEQGDSHTEYFKRAQRAAPMSPYLWYYCGAAELERGNLEQAWQDWRHSIELSDVCLASIAQLSSKHLSSAELMAKVLPPNPEIVYGAALRIYPQNLSKRIPFMQKALELLANGGELDAKSQLSKARIERDLGDMDAASKSYKELLSRNPENAPWRLEYAQFLVQQAQYKDARSELQILLAHHPGHAAARRLYGEVSRELQKELQKK